VEDGYAEAAVGVDVWVVEWADELEVCIVLVQGTIYCEGVQSYIAFLSQYERRVSAVTYLAVDAGSCEETSSSP
jgi:hypothetical protein